MALVSGVHTFRLGVECAAGSTMVDVATSRAVHTAAPPLWAAAARPRTVPGLFPQLRLVAVLLAGMLLSMGGDFPTYVAAANAAPSIKADDNKGGCPLPVANFEAIAHKIDPTQCMADPVFDNTCQVSCICEMVKLDTTPPPPVW
eukprot:1001683-Prorocentrum_minimum.AAC.1